VATTQLLARNIGHLSALIEIETCEARAGIALGSSRADAPPLPPPTRHDALHRSAPLLAVRSDHDDDDDESDMVGDANAADDADGDEQHRHVAARSGGSLPTVTRRRDTAERATTPNNNDNNGDDDAVVWRDYPLAVKLLDLLDWLLSPSVYSAQLDAEITATLHGSLASSDINSVASPSSPTNNNNNVSSSSSSTNTSSSSASSSISTSLYHTQLRLALLVLQHTPSQHALRQHSERIEAERQLIEKVIDFVVNVLLSNNSSSFLVGICCWYWSNITRNC
jgi:hypothetical protein